MALSLNHIGGHSAMALTPTQGDRQGRPYKNTVSFNPFASPCTGDPGGRPAGRAITLPVGLARLHSCDPLLATDASTDHLADADGRQAEEQMYDLDDPVRGTGIW